LSTAKALAAAQRKPLIPVDHLHGHVAANFLEPDPLDPPFLCLIASGGHTLLAGVREHSSYETLGATVDDAAGEAFDKGARLLGLGYPGGAALERLARDGDDHAHEFAVAMAGREGLDLSFSGLKTALRTAVLAAGADDTGRADLAASYQRALVRSLVSRTMRALEVTGRDTLAVVGGVAANGVLRSALEQECARAGVRLALAPLALCSDNAAMIASAARFCPALPYPEYLARDAYATA
jgi:N6-L-threonylcarbamoyladenine synthase